MKNIVIAAGYATRLGELTKNFPKPLLKIGNSTILGLGMEEKPQVPKSHWAVPPFYIYLKKDLDLVRHSVENGCGKDAPGNLAHYMVENTTMHAWPMSAGRFDIGSLDTYYEAVKRFG